MTDNELAIERLKDIKTKVESIGDSVALDMAISALSEELSEDGTLTVHVSDGSKVKRVFVMGDNIFGGLYYPDSAENKGDTVSRVAYEQIMWERDTAIQQLKDLGYGLGEKPKDNKDDFISRQAVERLVWKYLRKGTDENIAFYEHFLDVPSVENKGECENEGEWRTRDGFTYCSLCGFEKLKSEGRSYKFCPYCGKPMITAYTPYKAESEEE